MPTLDWLNRAAAFTTGQRFVMVEKMLNGMDMATQIRAAATS
jgi:hypothetical protein